MHRKLGIMLYALAVSLSIGAFQGNAGHLQCARGGAVHPVFKRKGKKKKSHRLK